ncbi:MAG: zf-HC2 domain-containing protein [Vicinamibacteria bacterium]|nr:zf-HC2 domain-containing protein [Vicinamibacteria bacterium]
MTDVRGACRVWELALALYVEGDLSESEVAPAEAHLAACASCRDLLAGLRESQASLHALAGEPIDAAALDVVRTRVRAKLAQRGNRIAVVWRWAVAASVVLTAGLIIVGLVSRRNDRSRETQATATAAPVVVVSRASAGAAETMPEAAPRSSGVRRAAVVRPHVPAPTLNDDASEEPDVPLTSAEADQLARAIVLLSRIEKLDDLGPDAEAPRDTPPTATVRLATGDPNVVIYWSFESNGGGS